MKIIHTICDKMCDKNCDRNPVYLFPGFDFVTNKTFLLSYNNNNMYFCCSFAVHVIY